jgi:hypothetical protein
MRVVQNNIKYYWQDNILSILKLNSNKYSISEIENRLTTVFISKNYCTDKNFKKSKCISYDKDLWNVLKLSTYRSKLRISVVMNFIIKFIINNDRPSTKFFSSDYDFKQLNNDEINKILNNL